MFSSYRKNNNLKPKLLVNNLSRKIKLIFFKIQKIKIKNLQNNKFKLVRKTNKKYLII